MGRYGTGNTLLPASGAEFDSQPHHRHFSDRRLANPAPLGLFAFAFSTFLLGLVNLRARGVNETAALVAPFLMYSSIMMGITAIFELISGNTFGATAFGTFAGFFLSLGAFLLPSFGTFDTFAANPLQIYSFLGLFFATWLIPFGIFCFLTIRSTWTLWLQFIFIFVSLALSCAQYLKNNDPKLQKAAGAILIVVSFFGYLNGSAGLMAKETVFFQPPVLQMPWSADRNNAARGHRSGGGAGHHHHQQQHHHYQPQPQHHEYQQEQPLHQQPLHQHPVQQQHHQYQQEQPLHQQSVQRPLQPEPQHLDGHVAQSDQLFSQQPEGTGAVYKNA